MFEPYAGANITRSQLRESESDARRLIARAAHIEKRAERACVESTEHMNLNAVAVELRAGAAQMLAEVSELSRRVRADLSATTGTRP